MKAVYIFVLYTPFIYSLFIDWLKRFLEKSKNSIVNIIMHIQHCMDLQVAVDPYKRRVLF